MRKPTILLYATLLLAGCNENRSTPSDTDVDSELSAVHAIKSGSSKQAGRSVDKSNWSSREKKVSEDIEEYMRENNNDSVILSISIDDRDYERALNIEGKAQILVDLYTVSHEMDNEEQRQKTLYIVKTASAGDSVVHIKASYDRKFELVTGLKMIGINGKSLGDIKEKYNAAAYRKDWKNPVLIFNDEADFETGIEDYKKLLDSVEERLFVAMKEGNITMSKAEAKTKFNNLIPIYNEMVGRFNAGGPGKDDLGKKLDKMDEEMDSLKRMFNSYEMRAVERIREEFEKKKNNYKFMLENA